MEAFALLKYWKGGRRDCNTVSGRNCGGVVAGELSSTAQSSSTSTSTRGTIVTTISNPDAELDDDDCDDDEQFFDLAFIIPNEEVEEAEVEGETSENVGKEIVDVVEDVVAESDKNDDVESSATTSGGGGERAELKFTVSSSSSSCDRTAHLNLSLSPSDDLLFKGRLLPIQPSSEVMNSKSSFHLAISLLKSATRLLVLTSGLKKSKFQQQPRKQMNQSEKNQQQQPQYKKRNQNDNGSNKFFTLKFKIEEVPIVSRFTRENSSPASNAENSSNKQPVQQQKHRDEGESAPSSYFKDGRQKYLKVKPLYVRVPKRHGNKLRFSGPLRLGFASKMAALAEADGESAKAKEEKAAAAVGNGDGRVKKQGNLAVGFRVMCKHLGTSKSVSTVVPSKRMRSRKRDDSLLQQQDGIQSAILHCKRSFNGCREAESLLLSRSSSDPSDT
ncbi:hypothetical protein Ancab_015366 [Ancistrocladus abbreviatus]